MGVAENRAGKAALSRNETSEKFAKRKRSDFFACGVERREPSASGERALQAGGAERSGTPLAAAVYGRAGGVFAVKWSFFCG